MNDVDRPDVIPSIDASFVIKLGAAHKHRLVGERVQHIRAIVDGRQTGVNLTNNVSYPPSRSPVENASAVSR
jgi:hypothetical protein